VAHERAHAQSAFAMIQRRIDRVYRAGPFQTFFAALIIAVSKLYVYGLSTTY
jgi:hypothetical protein